MVVLLDNVVNPDTFNDEINVVSFTNFEYPLIFNVPNMPKDLFFSLKRPKFALNLQKFALNNNTDRGHPATFRRVIQPSAGSRAVISTREQSRRAKCASHGARLQRPGPQNGPAL